MAILQDSTSLDNLHDLVVPDAAPWWPPAPGWYLLGSLILLAAIFLIVNRISNWQRNRYRGRALEELSRLRQSTRNENSPSQLVAGLDQILKRVALAAWPRQEVATLAGEEWMQFLNRTGRGRVFTPEQADALRDAAYSSRISGKLSSDDLERLCSDVERWIRQHEAPDAEFDTSVHGSTA